MTSNEFTFLVDTVTVTFPALHTPNIEHAQ